MCDKCSKAPTQMTVKEILEAVARRETLPGKLVDLKLLAANGRLARHGDKGHTGAVDAVNAAIEIVKEHERLYG